MRAAAGPGDRRVSWRWRARLGPVYRRPAAGPGGRTLFVPSADGHLYALDADTGLVSWRFAAGAPVLSEPLVTPEFVVFTAGERLLAVRAATVSGTQALEAGTGAPRWTFPGGTMYPPAAVLGDGTVLLTTEQGVVSRVGLADGGTAWQAGLGVRVQNAGLAVAGDSAWVVSASGWLVRVRLADGHVRGSLRYALAHCFSAPAVTGDTLVAGDQDGVVHGIRLPFG